MKEVIKPSGSKSVVMVNEVDSSKFYGAVIGGNRGLLLQNEWKGTGFQSRILDLMTAGNANSYGALESARTLKEAVEAILGDGDQVFEFDTLTELARWMEAK
jgi:hypothetical protein